MVSLALTTGNPPHCPNHFVASSRRDEVSKSEDYNNFLTRFGGRDMHRTNSADDTEKVHEKEIMSFNLEPTKLAISRHAFMTDHIFQ